ncbi:MAG: hypothetical protein EPN61_14185 [Burkholderiaceae bacterium]|nr:MAG: hypothetical protein EPN61_14185 [Burkholderiaceae bacterium]
MQLTPIIAIHLSAATFIGLAVAFGYLARHNITGHRRAMQITYIAACLVAGGFTFLPGRLLGDLLLQQLQALA